MTATQDHGGKEEVGGGAATSPQCEGGRQRRARRVSARKVDRDAESMRLGGGSGGLLRNAGGQASLTPLRSDRSQPTDPQALSRRFPSLGVQREQKKEVQ